VLSKSAWTASGGSLNLSMLLSGLPPAEICQRWRTLCLADTISFLPIKDYPINRRQPLIGPKQ